MESYSTYFRISSHSLCYPLLFSRKYRLILNIKVHLCIQSLRILHKVEKKFKHVLVLNVNILTINYYFSLKILRSVSIFKVNLRNSTITPPQIHKNYFLHSPLSLVQKMRSHHRQPYF